MDTFDLMTELYGTAEAVEESAEDDEIQLNGEIAAQLLHEWAASAEQFFRDMPRWKPGRQNGHVVRARVTFPLHYRLQ
jgi:hypothetical protein